jgi:hypothetical protein
VGWHRSDGQLAIAATQAKSATATNPYVHQTGKLANTGTRTRKNDRGRRVEKMTSLPRAV